MSLLDLPIELLSLIGDSDSISLHDARALRLVCRKFSLVFASRIFRHLTLSVDRSNYELELTKLRILSSGNPLAAGLTTTLSIDSLSPYSLPVEVNEDGDLALQLSTGAHHSAYVEDATLSEASSYILSHLEKALSVLRNVRTFYWRARPGRDPMGTYKLLKSFLCSTDITSFCFGFDYDYGPEHPNSETSENLQIPLESMAKSLRSMDLDVCFSSTGGALGPNDPIHHLSRCIGSFINLSSLTLSLEEDIFWDSMVAPMDLLTFVVTDFPTSVTPLQLKELALVNTIPRIQHAPQTIRHLLHLKYVRLDVPTYIVNQTISESLMSEFWDALKYEQIYLESIQTTFPVASLMDYLEGYCGLKKLKFSTGCSWVTLNPALGRRFFAHTLPPHSATLQYLHVGGLCGVSGWKLSADTASTLLICQKLQKISGCVEGIQFVGESLDLGELPALMGTFLGLPQLRKVRILVSQSIHRSHWPMVDIQAAVLAAMRNLSIPATRYKAEQLWLIGVGEAFFRPVLNPAYNTWKWKHCDPDTLDLPLVVEWEEASDDE